MLGLTAAARIIKAAFEIFYQGEKTADLGQRFVHLGSSIAAKLAPHSRRRYLRDLRQKLGAMPFIYHGAEGVILSDYVPAMLRPAGFEPLHSHERRNVRQDPHNDHDYEEALRSLRTSPRGLFLADAGMGKTTFFSYIAVCLTLKKPLPAVAQLFGDVRPIPIFVPLKVLDNSTSRPILGYIRALPLFQGQSGFKRFARFADQGRLLLILDGYDEVYIPNDDAPAIKTEIDSFFSMKLESLPGDDGSLAELTSIYRSLDKNRVWLSSRREHYYANRLSVDFDDPFRTKELSQVAAVELLGLKQRRDLVKRIFDRSRSKSEFLNDELSEDAFFGYLSRTLDDETTELSYNPLFLTIMTYLYIKGIESREERELEGTLNLRSLVTKCVRVLLSDLDEFRARGLPNRIRRALIEHRGLYPERKFAFLCYLSYRVLTDSSLSETLAITEQTLRGVAREFFTSLTRDHEVEDILRNLEASDARSFVRQLILQGVFVLVDRNAKQEFFDFPHRRFREVLAVEYFDSAPQFGDFLPHVGTPHFREFVIIMFRISERRRNEVLTQLLTEPDHDSNGYLVTLARTCLENCPAGYNPTAVIEAWVRKVRPGSPSANYVSELLKFATPSVEFVSWADLKFTTALARRDHDEVLLFGTILHIARKGLFLAHVSEALEVADAETARLAASTLVQLDPGASADLLLGTRTKSALRAMCTALMVTKGITGREPWWMKLCSTASEGQLATLLAASIKYNEALSPRVLGFQRITRLPGFVELRSHASGSGSGVYLLSGLIFDLMDVRFRDRLALDIVRRMDEGILENLDDLEKRIPKPSFKDTVMQLHPDWPDVFQLQPSEIEAVEAAMERTRRNVISEIRRLASSKIFWSSQRWLAFLALVEAELSTLPDIYKAA